jgi:hypothetical protein
MILLLFATIAAAAFASHRPGDANSLTTYNTSTSSSPPTVVGWGGVRLDESQANLANPTSQVFPGETASNMELQVQRLQAKGFNAIRVSFQSVCSSPQEMGSYNPTWLNRAITIAKHYNFWIIIDYHGYNDLTSPTGVNCWLGYWGPIVQQFMGAYNQIIWEPINEPAMTSSTDVASLSSAYQQWANQARGLGDTHWIVVQNLCSGNCGFSNMADGYPTVNDTQGKIFISLHSYMGYKWYSSSWNNATADSLAQQFYTAVVSGSQRTGWPVLNTEGGPDPQGISCSGGVPLPSPLCAPDQVQVGSAGYSITTFHFIQTLTKLYDSNTPQRINWLWWPMGSWTDTPLAELTFGALSSDGWGSLLRYNPVSVPGGTNSPLLTVPGNQIVSAYSHLVFQINASGASSNQILTLSAVNLPANSTFRAVTGNTVSGTFSWTPTQSQVGTYTVGFTATDTSNSSIRTTGVVAIQVQGLVGTRINNPPVLAVPGVQTVIVGSTVTFRVSATDADLPIEILTLSLSGQPAGSSFDPNTGTFSWTPKPGEEGTYIMTFKAMDNGTPQMSDSKTVSVQVTSGPGGPGGSNGSGGSCYICSLFSPLGSISSTGPVLWLLLVGLTLGFSLSVLVVISRKYRHGRAGRASP